MESAHFLGKAKIILRTFWQTNTSSWCHLWDKQKGGQGEEVRQRSSIVGAYPLARSRTTSGTVTIPQYRFNKTKQHENREESSVVALQTKKQTNCAPLRDLCAPKYQGGLAVWCSVGRTLRLSPRTRIHH